MAQGRRAGYVVAAVIDAAIAKALAQQNAAKNN